MMEKGNFDENKWKNEVNKKIIYKVNNIWNGIKQVDIERFLKNFNEQDEIVGFALLDMLNFYNYDQEEHIVNNLFRLYERDVCIKNNYFELNSIEIKKKVKEIYEETCFIPVTDRGPADSAYAVTSIFKKNLSLKSNIKNKENMFIDYKNIPLYYMMGKRYFVFIDDLIGTGSQFEKFVNDNLLDKYSIADIMKWNEQAHFYYLAMGGCYDGIEKIEKDIANITVIVSELFNESADILNPNNEYWKYNPDLRDRVIDYIKNKEVELKVNNKYSKNLPLLFEHGRAPNTVLSLYWLSCKQWNALYER